ncbi:flagellar basal body rod C-terminal domain-containing protein [Sulfurospirillum barnesii]|uniref:Flagellar hook protein FlgE n=1 Tax=Sulfurospirillum barnesii (strain ATCC 700032 / DSM 10660 / SES-3) TaxID=760154 RepID=I3XXX9_SULBS|nr:flagellar basal body rod C-terminal domain-containing protein [Sulfurospirillum barnesii]AFL68803.1 flagellar hook protein FlgE [Sulfurospirillum barnesii SES-3]
MQVNANAMMAMSNWMGNNAHNVANVNTDEFKATQTTLSNQSGSVVAQSRATQSGTDLANELSEQVVIEASFEANTKPIQTQNEMLGSLLDMKA